MITHKLINISIAENLILSTKAPMINAGVMIANVIWNVAKRLSGTVPETLSISIDFIKRLLKSPIQTFPDVKAKL